jgi:hypothetical protein
VTEQQSRRRPWLVASLAVAGVLAAGGVTLAIVPWPHHRSAATDAASSPQPASPSAMPSAEPEPGLTVTPSPAAGGDAVTATPATTSKAKKSRGPALPQKPVGRPTGPLPTVSYQEGVTVDDPCTPADAVGHTTDGTLVTCGPLLPDHALRWRVVVPPPPLN